MEPVDCHCHLYFDRFDGDRQEVLQRAKEKLEFIVNVGTDFSSNQATLELAKKHQEFVKSNLGLHPTSVEEFDRTEDVKRQIEDNDPAAVGEIGLDHHHVTDEKVREKQKDVFRQFLELAEKMGKPVNVHSRDAEGEVIRMMEGFDLEDGLIHCFNGSPEQAARAAESGFKIGVTTQIVYSSGVRKIVERLRLEDIVLETDSPFLYQSGRNEPVNVLESAKEIAEIKEKRIKEVVEQTTTNARDIFK
jgi:TatD DNase family protein